MHLTMDDRASDWMASLAWILILVYCLAVWALLVYAGYELYRRFA